MLVLIQKIKNFKIQAQTLEALQSIDCTNVEIECFEQSWCPRLYPDDDTLVPVDAEVPLDEA